LRQFLVAFNIPKALTTNSENKMAEEAFSQTQEKNTAIVWKNSATNPAERV
jgi:hypothetical protein